MTAGAASQPLVAVRRQRVALAGHVLQADCTRAGGGCVNLVRQPVAGDAASDEPRQVKVARDGRYFFVNLAAGDYIVDGQDERGRLLAPRRVSVPPVDRTQRPAPLDFDLTVQAKVASKRAGART